ncbi:4-amino-4-deoxy-L-arabinose transferase-like glycosyltransferase [Chitinivorax tropicus]|uniref:4-amino-4-deoxy-L-arabinose transferase-like glycosyltransferase n=1 Tax=Chitinivorax tropicus TaxID=714531 RepID=A0A840MGK0_9PROT|nr:hypothetical protein [Chitinivorax tropicus]MBB5017530.1 4-amino-4-deoxy-L-arabinose transferase-like glycosyltransferase [Chitinivorax tropicus]
MLTYTPQAEVLSPKTHERPWALFLLCLIWLLPGVIGHAPWKPDEPHTIGIIHAMQQGHWLIPQLAGQQTWLDGPLYFQLTAVLAGWLGGWLALHDVARALSAVFVALVLTFCGGIGRELIGRRFGRVVVILMIGCLGLIVLGHTAISSTATMAGYAAAFYGMSLFKRRWIGAALALGLGAALAANTGSLHDAVVIWVIAGLLPVCFGHWRDRAYARVLIWAVVLAAPAMLIWPMMLYQHSPALLGAWWKGSVLGRLYGNGAALHWGELDFYLRTLPWFSWPALPIAAWALWDGRLTGYDRPVLQFSVLALLVIALGLVLSPIAQDDYLLPLLIPICVLAASVVDRLKRGAAAALNWFGVMTFGMLGLYIWLGWTAYMTGIPPQLARRADKVIPGFIHAFSIWDLLIGLALTATWIWAVSRRRQMGRQALSSWASGVALCWSLLMLLWLPGIDWVKGYQQTVASMKQSLPAQYQCISTDRMSADMAALFNYHGGLAVRWGANESCDLMLVMGTRDEVPPKGHWRKLWEGARPGDGRERLRLYQQFEPASIRL